MRLHKSLFLLLLWLAVAGCPPAGAQQASVTLGALAAQSLSRERVFDSKAMGRSMRYRVLLPANYFTSDCHYPVLYLLHGWHGDRTNWEQLTHFYDYTKDLQLIVVMPDAGDSWYVNSATVPQDRFEEYVLQDLIGDVDLNWRTIPSRNKRAIAGISMGGYGALKFAMKNPRTFGIAASLSGAFNAPGELAELREDLAESLLRAFGPPNTSTRSENDLYAIAHASSPSKVPYLYINCGSDDRSFIEPNRKLIQALSAQGLAYEYHEYNGAHTWTYWDQQLPALLRTVKSALTAD